MTVAVITQPTYLPWLGYFEAIARADVFVFLDTVQFQRRSWQSRNRLKGANGEPFWLTVPISAAPQTTPIREIEIATDASDWSRRHLRSIEAALASAPHLGEAMDLVGPILSSPPRKLVDLTTRIIEAHCESLDLAPTILRASALRARGHRSQLLVDICKEIGATAYYSAAGSRTYMEAEWDIWQESGLQVSFQDWDHPFYPQQGTLPFVSHLAAIDALANVGSGDLRRILTEGGRGE